MVQAVYREWDRRGGAHPGGVIRFQRTARDRAARALPWSFNLFCLYTFVLVGRPQDYLPFLAPLRLALTLTVLTCVVTVLSSGAPARPARAPETRLYLLLFATMCAGIPFSVYPRGSFNFVILIYAATILYYLLFVRYVNRIERYNRILIVLTIAGFLFSAFGLVQGEFREGRYSTGSQMFDPNDVAFVVVSLLPFALCVLLGRFGRLVKAVALCTVLLSVLLALYTGSRGGLLGLLTIFILFLLRVPTVKKSHKIALLALLITGAAVNADKINTDRYATLENISTDYNMHDEYGRTQIWKRGLHLFAEDPLTGVGVNGFEEAVGMMRGREDLPATWQAPHSSYIQILTETGIVGAVAFGLLILTCARNFNRLRSSGPLARSNLAGYPSILLIGFIGQLVSALFLSQAYSVSFTLFFAASAALRQIALTMTHSSTHA